ncbi:hypothetical protein PI124_g18858, partial [Phytophthora idaei]
MASEVFDGKMQTFERSDITCSGGGRQKDTVVFLVEAGDALSIKGGSVTAMTSCGARYADLDNPAIMQQTDMKRQLMSSCSPTIATTPLLPSIGSISPANTTT